MIAYKIQSISNLETIAFFQASQQICILQTTYQLPCCSHTLIALVQVLYTTYEERKDDWNVSQAYGLPAITSVPCSNIFRHEISIIFR